MTNLLAWLETLPENVLRSRLRLRIYQACAFFFDGQNTECVNILEESKKAIQELPSSLENNSMREELSRLIEIVYALMNGLALSLQGKLDQSSQIILQAKHLAEEVGNIFLLAHAYEGLALNLYNQGQLWSAASTSRQLIELAEGAFGRLVRVSPCRSPRQDTSYRRIYVWIKTNWRKCTVSCQSF